MSIVSVCLQAVEEHTQHKNARIQQHGDDAHASISSQDTKDSLEERRQLLRDTLNESDIVKFK